MRESEIESEKHSTAIYLEKADPQVAQPPFGNMAALTAFASLAETQAQRILSFLQFQCWNRSDEAGNLPPYSNKWSTRSTLDFGNNKKPTC